MSFGDHQIQAFKKGKKYLQTEGLHKHCLVTLINNQGHRHAISTVDDSDWLQYFNQIN